MRNQDCVDNIGDNCVDNLSYRESYPSAPAVFPSFPTLTPEVEGSLFLDPAPPTCVGGRGQGVSRNAGEGRIFIRNTAGADKKRFIYGEEVKREGERDLELVKLLLEQRYLDFGQIVSIFFNGKKGNASRRLSQLITSQIVRRQSVRVVTKDIRLYTATERARRIYEGPFGIAPEIPKHIVPSHITHSLLVTEVRLRFGELWKHKWIPETVLKPMNMGLTPDGVIHFESTSHKVAIEVENTIKSTVRYGEIFRAYKKSEYFLAIYVATHKSIFEALKTQMKANSYQAPLGIFLWDEFKTSKPKLWTPIGFADILERGV